MPTGAPVGLFTGEEKVELPGVAEDSAAFEAVMAAYALPKDSDAQVEARTVAIAAAYRVATQTPLQAARAAAEVSELARTAAEIGNRNAISDAASATHLARASLTAAAHNVRINAGELADREEAAAWLAEVDRLQARAEEAVAGVEALVKARHAGAQ